MSSPLKSKSSLSLMSEDRFIAKAPPKCSVGEVYNTMSSKPSASVIYKKQNVYNPANRPGSMIPATSEVRQRVLSARRLRIKNYQNQLAEAKQTIEDLLHENRLLQTLHKRQDTALAKYESSNAELPQLLNAHSEELRMWQTKYKNLQLANKDLESKMKQKESIILSLTDQNKYFSQLNKDKNLLERQQLRDENEALINEIKEKDNELKLLQKRMDLEIKHLKSQLHNEQKKSRNAIVEIEKCRVELNAFSKLDSMNLNNVPTRRMKATNPKDTSKFDALLEKAIESTAEVKKYDPPARKEVPGRHSHSTTNAARNDRGDGDAAQNHVVKKQPKMIKPIISKTQPARPKNEKEIEKKVPEKMELKEVGEEIIGTLDLKDAPIEKEPEESTVREYFNASEYIDKMSDAEDDSIQEDTEDDKFSETEFNTKRMRSNISHIRKNILGEDYERREEFIDGFCLQNSLHTNIDEDEDEEKYRNFTKDNLRSVMKNA